MSESLNALLSDVLALAEMVDQIVFTAVVTAAIGASLGWYFRRLAGEADRRRLDQTPKSLGGTLDPA